MQSETALIVMVKPPVAGRVKTRLAKATSHEIALEAYTRLLLQTRQLAEAMVAHHRWDIRWQIAPIEDPQSADWLESFIPSDHTMLRQSGSELGSRMLNAFTSAFTDGYRRVVMIGGDCPEIDTHYLTHADAKLTKVDLVLGPAADGGYVLIGLSDSPHPALFDGPQWSTGDVLSETIAISEQQQISYALLSTLSDIDTAADLSHFPRFDPRQTAN